MTKIDQELLKTFTPTEQNFSTQHFSRNFLAWSKWEEWKLTLNLKIFQQCIYYLGLGFLILRKKIFKCPNIWPGYLKISFYHLRTTTELSKFCFNRKMRCQSNRTHIIIHTIIGKNMCSQRSCHHVFQFIWPPSKTIGLCDNKSRKITKHLNTDHKLLHHTCQPLSHRHTPTLTHICVYMYTCSLMKITIFIIQTKIIWKCIFAYPTYIHTHIWVRLWYQ